MSQKVSKWEGLEKDALKYGIFDIYEAYKKKIVVKNPNIKHLAWKVFSDYLLIKKSDK